MRDWCHATIDPCAVVGWSPADGSVSSDTSPSWRPTAVPVAQSRRWCQLLPDLPDKPRQPLFVPPQSGVRRLPMVPSPLAEKELTRLRVSWVDGLLGVVLWLSRQAACALT